MDFTSGLESRTGAAPSSSYIIRSVERSQPAERPSTILQGSRCFFITINPDRAVITIPDVYQSNGVIQVINAFSSRNLIPSFPALQSSAFLTGPERKPAMARLLLDSADPGARRAQLFLLVFAHAQDR